MKLSKNPKAIIAMVAGGIVVIAGFLQGIYATGIQPYSVVIGTLLVILGGAIGFLNITKKEQVGFLVGSIALLVISIASVTSIIPESLGVIATILTAMFGYLIALLVPVALVTGVKVVAAAMKN